MDNVTIERYFSAHPALETGVTDHQTVVLFTKEIVDVDKSILVGNIPPLKFLSGPKKEVITGHMQGAWEPDRSVAVVMALSVPVEEYLPYIGINSRIAVICL